MIKAKIDLVPITFYSLPASAWHLAVIRVCRTGYCGLQKRSGSPAVGSPLYRDCIKKASATVKKISFQNFVVVWVSSSWKFNDRVP